MSNLQDHPGSPPAPSPSNSSSSTPPSASPKPRFRRQKMLARKTVASGALRKVLNERLKVSQVKESPDPKSDSSSEYESFQSATEGDGHGSSGSKKTQESPSEVSSSMVENLETRFVPVEPIRDVELPEMSRSGGWASYDPKKRKAIASKVLNVTKPSKKRKASSPTPTASSVPRGRATRSRVKQCEANLQKALEESKKKKKDRGKGKVAESSEAFEEEEMELVHQERGTTMEVTTPKPKKPKTSSKKSSSVPIAAEPTLAKRTRAAVKAKQTKMEGRLARNELIEFLANDVVKDGVVSSQVKGVQVQFDAVKLGEILDIPSEGFDDYTRKRWPCLDSLPTALEITKRFCDSENVNKARSVQKSEMRPQHKVVFEFANKCLLPRQERRHTTNYMDLVLMECLERGKQINWPALTVKLLDRVINGSKAHSTPYGFILTTVLDRLNVPLKK
uniref:Uncharacterized protein n=1 Tax=Nicotiana tabacum TaxID=4097 RepID=A0A1S3YUI7_TOBAC|nr:PREDICTED: uncharacterized protein LOC107779701 [Nicotiana tabacum]